MDEFDRYTITELKRLLRERGLSVSSRLKEVLVIRLRTAVLAEENDSVFYDRSDNSGRTNDNSDQNHTEQNEVHASTVNNSNHTVIRIRGNRAETPTVTTVIVIATITVTKYLQTRKITK